MARRKRVEVKPLFHKEEVFSKHGPDGDHGGEDTRGADGKPVYPGVFVRVNEYKSVRLGITVPTRFGVVKRLYRMADCKCPDTGEDVVVEAWDRGSRFFYLNTVRRSARQTDEVKADKAALAAAEKADVIAAEGN